MPISAQPTTIARRTRRRGLREAYWQLRQWLGVVRTILPRSGPLPIRTAELGSWLDEAHASSQGDMVGRRLLIFAYLPWWMDFMAAVSATLVARGADVTFVWLPYAAFDADTPEMDERMIARYAPILTKPRARFRSLNLAEVEAPLAPMSDRLKRMAYVDTQYVLRREEVEIDGADRQLNQFRLNRLRHAQGAFSRLLHDGKYDSVLLPSGGVLEFAAVWQAASDAGVDSVTIETWERRGACAVAYGRPVFSEIAKEAWAADAKKLDGPRRARVEENMRGREGAGWTGHIVSYQNAAIKGADELRAQLGLDARRPVALVCPNVPYDAAFLGLQTGFASMAEWLRTVLRELQSRTDWQVVVRAHPGEIALNSRQSAESIFRQAFSHQPEHIHFVAPADAVNTYALMRIAKVGLVFGSTTGLEMVARGLPVVMPVQTHFSGKGFTDDAFTRDDYLARLRTQLDRPASLTQEQVDLAWCYIDVYMNQWCRPFPWCLATFPSDVRDWPLRRVLDGDGVRHFADTFTILGGGERARALVATPPALTAVL